MNAGPHSQSRGRGLPPVLWPALGLSALLLFNFFFAPGFFRLQVLDGHLYGTLIDILNQGAKVMLLAIGMTLVIATGGVDLSIGSIMAIAGAIAATLVATTQLPFGAIIPLTLFLTTIVGSFNGILIAYIGIQ